MLKRIGLPIIRNRFFQMGVGLAFASALWAAPKSAVAQPELGPGRPEGRLGRPHFMAGPPGFGLPIRELDLSENQKDRMREIMEDTREDIHQAGKKLGDAEAALEDGVLQGGDESSLRSLAEAVGVAYGDLAALHAGVQARLVEILTPEQKQELEKLLADRKSRFDRMRERFNRRQRHPGSLGGAALRRPSGSGPAGDDGGGNP